MRHGCTAQQAPRLDRPDHFPETLHTPSLALASKKVPWKENSFHLSAPPPYSPSLMMSWVQMQSQMHLTHLTHARGFHRCPDQDVLVRAAAQDRSFASSADFITCSKLSRQSVMMPAAHTVRTCERVARATGRCI